MTMEQDVELLKNYIASLQDFIIVDPEYPYNHMGATIADAILQAGTRWETVVAPRIDKLMDIPKAKTTSGFLDVCQTIGLKTLLKWNGDEKPNRILRVTQLFVNEGIETESDLKEWLQNDNHIKRLKAERGIGDKTIDYFKMLSGIQTSAVDRHLIKFINRAGISVDADRYDYIRELINKTADEMNIAKTVLDYSIWRYMSSEGETKSCQTPTAMA